MNDFNEFYWDNRYKTNNIGWDLAEVSPPIKAYVDQLTNKSLRILIPGGGNSYEAEYLFNLGFKNVYVVDISRTALENIKHRVPKFPKHHLIHKDFFELDMTFDLILEQTFFCAIHPSLRPKYVFKMKHILITNGKLVGLLFNIPLNSDHPPFGGSLQEYRKHFESFFNIEIMEIAHNSHQSRAGKEVFFSLKKKVRLIHLRRI